MTEPLTLRIGFDNFKVLPLTEAQSVEMGIDGRINWNRDGVAGDCVILINSNSRPSRQAEILIHELLHAAYHLGGIDNDKKLTEEEVCTGLDGPLTKIFMDNPNLLAVIMQALQRGVPVVGREGDEEAPWPPVLPMPEWRLT